MAKTSKEWADMTAEERKAETTANKAQAIEAVEKGKLPTGIKVTVGGKDYIARPVRVTESGGVTYNLSPRPATVGKYGARFNKFSFTILGEGSAETMDSFDEENLL